MNIWTACISLVITMIATIPAFADSARVITRENAVREDCRFFSPVRTKVKLNDILTVISRESDWVRVDYKGTKGCIHKSAVDEKNIDISKVSGTKTTTASRDEVALAGKGFNPEVEKSFKKKHPELDFQTVDRIEEYSASDESLQQFIKSGGLNQP